MTELLNQLEFLKDIAWVPWLILTAALFVLWTIWKSNTGSDQKRNTVHLAHFNGDGGEEMLEMRKEVRRLEKETTTLSKFLLLLPEFTKELNSPMERNQIGDLLVGIVGRLFEPEQILVFYNDKRVNQLILHSQRGYDERVGRNFKIPVGEGKIGWVAKNQTAMSTQDFIYLMRSDGSKLDSPNQSRVKPELVIPMVHEDDTLGVISIGGISQHFKHEKRVGKMIGDLGSIALHNNQLFRELQEAANSDGLTRLYNKKYFLFLLGEQIVNAERDHTNFSLFMFDLDHFKKLNDTYGHLAGDDVLKIMGKIMRDTAREDDLAARYGGEEFLILLPDTKKDGAFIAAEKIRKALESHEFTNDAGKPMRKVTLSGGISTFPDDGRGSTALIQAADTALYRAKQAGRNQIVPAETKYFSNEDDEVVVQETLV